MINRLNLKNKKISPIFIGVILLALFLFAFVKESNVKTIQGGYAIDIPILNSVTVALDRVFNPNNVVALSGEIRQKVVDGKGIFVEDVFRRCEAQSENGSSNNYRLNNVNPKVGINNGIPIVAFDSGDEVTDYSMWKNANSLDIGMGQIVGIVTSDNPDVTTDFIKRNNDRGFVPIIRICLEQNGAAGCPFKMEENADSLVNFVKAVGDKLIAERKGYRAVFSLGPNEPNTGDPASVAAAFGLSSFDYVKLVQRQNQAASQLQDYRVINGGPFWLGTAIFNGTQTEVVGGVEYSYDIYNHMFVEDGGNDKNANYKTRRSIDSRIFDVVLLNVYSDSNKTADNYYKDYQLKAFVDNHPHLVTIISEFGAITADVSKESLKNSFKALLDDPKVEGINFFRSTKDLLNFDPSVAPPENQRLSLQDLITFTESSSRGNRKVALTNSAWLNCNLPSSLYSVATSNSSSNFVTSSKGGLNQGSRVTENQDATNALASSVGLNGYTLGIVVSPSEVSQTVDFINDTPQGTMPIVRLCYIDGCEFNLSGGNPDDLIKFFRSVRDGASRQFIAIIGVNEPSSEFAEFNTSSVGEVANATFAAARALGKDSKMLLAPAAFNLVNPKVSEFQVYVDAGMRASDFDVIIGNAYNQSDYVVETAIQSALDFAKGNNLKFILTETGNIRERTSIDFATTAAKICPKVDGFLLFRSTEGAADGAYENKPQIFNNDQLKSIAQACATGSAPTTASFNPGGIALACGAEFDKPDDFYYSKNSAGLKVVCAGETCTTKKQGVVEISAPFKLFTTSSPTGTTRLSMIPVSQVAAASSGSAEFDALNNFAGAITIGGKSYPFPGLGSAINAATKILPETMTDKDPTLVLRKSTGSLYSTTLAKVKSQVESNNAVKVSGGSNTGLFSNNVASVTTKDSNQYSIDDRAVCYDGECFNNDSGLADWRKTIFPYNPTASNITYLAPRACSRTNMKFSSNLDDYVTGPEMIIEEESTVFSGSSSEVCRLYANRNLESTSPVTSGGGIKSCGYVFDNSIFPDADQGALSSIRTKPFRNVIVNGALRVEYTEWTCKELKDGVGRSPLGTFRVDSADRLPDCDFADKEFNEKKGDIPLNRRSGYCNIDQKFTSCLRYDQKPTDQIYIHTDSYPTVPRVQIPDVMEAIYRLYDRLQTILSQRGVKFVAQENLGAKLNVTTKIRDASNPIESKDYLFAKQTDSVSTMPKLISNEFDLANNTSSKTQYQYFDYLGYINVLQELIVAYANESTLPGDNVVNNPFPASSGLFPADKKVILAGGPSNLLMAHPVLTCDQVEICKKFTVDELTSTYGEAMAAKLCPLKTKLDASKQYNCITNLEDRRYNDILSDALCVRGFATKEGCSFQCNVIENNSELLPPSGKVTCPVQIGSNPGLCYAGPGVSSHRNSLNAIDLTRRSGEPGTMNVVAPFDGRIVRKLNGNEYSRCSNQAASGGSVFYEGTVYGKKIGFFIYHVNTAAITKTEFRAGEVIAPVTSRYDSDFSFYCSLNENDPNGKPDKLIDPFSEAGRDAGCACWSGAHAHIEFADLSGDFANLPVSQIRGRINKGDPGSQCLNSFMQKLGCRMNQGNLNCTANQQLNLSCLPSYGTGTVVAEDINQELTSNNDSYEYSSLFPVSRNRQILQCAEPSSVRVVNLEGTPVVNENNLTKIELIPEAAASLEKMFTDIKRLDSRVFADCAVAWGYRNAELQGSFSDSCSSGTACKCHSEHQLGTTVDFRTQSNLTNASAFNGSLCSNWLRSNAANYGFVQSYTGADPDYKSEPWHYRYIGIDKAIDFKKKEKEFKYLRAYLEAQGSNVITQGGQTTTSGGALQCIGGSGDSTDDGSGGSFSSTKSYKNLHCLIREVSQSVSKNYKNGLPDWAMAAIMDYEAGRPFLYPKAPINAGKPGYVSQAFQNSEEAMGPLQITKNGWRWLFTDSARINAILKCTAEIGLTGVKLDPEDSNNSRAVLGIALCASGVFQLGRMDLFQGLLASPDVQSSVRRHLGEEFLDKTKNYVVPASQWTSDNVKVDTYKYYGACKTSTTFKSYDGTSTNDYCESVSINASKLKKVFEALDCSPNSSSTPLSPLQVN